MAAPRWKKLVDELKASGHESPYLDRLQERLGALGALSLNPHQNLQLEILQEMAQALGATEDKVNVALLELDVAGRKLDAVAREKPGSPEHRALVERFNHLRDVALDKRRDLMIHREAVGFLNHDAVMKYYPVPPARALDAG